MPVKGLALASIVAMVAGRFHTAVYVVTLLLLATGWWLLAGREG